MDRYKIPVALLAGALAGFVGLWLVPAASSRLGPSTVQVQAYPGIGETRLSIPPLGTVNADTQRSPITIEVGLQEVSIEELGPLATTEAGRTELRAQVETDLRPLIVKSSLQLGIGMLVIGALVGAILFRRELWPTLAATGGALIVAAGLLLSTGFSYDVESFREPRFTGSLQRARGVIDALQQNVGLLDEAGTRYEIATTRAAALLAMLANPQDDPRQETTAVLHVSDIHGNPIGLDVTQQLAEEFDVDAIVDTGDLASSSFDTGELSKLSAPLDRSMIRRIGRLPAPYLFVAGNHDSFDLRRTLETAPNVEYLDGDSAQIGVLDVFGWADPTYTPEDVDPSEKAGIRIEEGDAVAAEVIETGPDVLIVHDPRLGVDSLGHVPVILAGHMHERAIVEQDGTIMLTVGSTGATGLKSFTVEADRDYEAEILYFDGNDLVGMDYVTVRSLGSEFVIERSTFP